MKNLGLASWAGRLLAPAAAPLARAAAPRALLPGLRAFSAGLPVREAPAGERPRVTPLPVRELVAFKAKYVRPETTQPLLEAPELYAKIHIHNWSMLVTEGDVIKLPVNMRDVAVGDTLEFSEVSEIGSRQHTLSGERIDPAVFRIRGTVLEKTRVRRSIEERTRRRRRHVRHVVSHNALTVIRVSELRVLPVN